jgi:hypothetical protein
VTGGYSKLDTGIKIDTGVAQTKRKPEKNGMKLPLKHVLI